MNPQPKEKRIINKHYTNWLKKQQCASCCMTSTQLGQDVVPAHQNLGYGKMGGKEHDIFAVPLCVACHAIEHAGHDKFWGDITIPKLILLLWKQYSATEKKSPFYGLDFYREVVINTLPVWK